MKKRILTLSALDPQGEIHFNALQNFYDTSPLLMGIVIAEDSDLRFVEENRASTTFFGLAPRSERIQLASKLPMPQPQIELWLKHLVKSKSENLLLNK